jgi:hypothetical protein
MAGTFIYERTYLEQLNNRNVTHNRVQGVVNEKSKRINTFLNEVTQQLKTINNDGQLQVFLQQLKSPMPDFVFFIYKNAQTIYWSNNNVELSYTNKANIGNEKIGYLGSTYYEFFKQKTGPYQVTGLLFIKRSQSGFENKYIQNNFNSDFELTDNVFFATNKSAKQNFEIVNTNNEPIFSLFFEGDAVKPISDTIPILFF